MRKHIITLLGSILLVAVLALAAGCAGEQSQARLQARAKISQAEAQKTALAQTPGGTIKEASLEEEKGKLIWSFDIAVPGARDITEIQVDALTGKIVSTEQETPAQEAKEKQGEQK